MIKMFRNRMCLYTLTTATISFLQNGVVVSASVEERNRRYDVAVFPMNLFGAFPSVSPMVNSNNNSHLRQSRSSGVDPNSLSVSRGESGDDVSVGVSLNGSRGDRANAHLSRNSNIPEISITPIYQSGQISGPISAYKDVDWNGYIYLSGHEVLDPTEFSGEGYLRIEYKKVGSGESKLVVYDGLYYMCEDCGTDTIDNRSYKAIRGGELTSTAAIMVKGIGAEVSGKNVTVSGNASVETFLVGVHVLEKGKITLEDPILKGTIIALRASDGVIKVKNGIIEQSQEGVDATENSFVLLENTEIKTSDGQASLLSYDGSAVWMAGGSINFMNSDGVSSTSGGKVNLNDVKITGKDSKGKNHAVLHTNVGGPINLDGTTVLAVNLHGILSENTVRTSNSILQLGDLSDDIGVTEVNIKSSSVTVEGDGSYGIYFKGERPLTEFRLSEENSSEKEKTPQRLELVNLEKTMFSVQDDAIHSVNITNAVVNLTQSTLSSENFLLKAEKGASLAILAVSSNLEGGAYVDEISTAKLYLGAGSTWILQQKQPREPYKADLANTASLSLVNLIGDSIIKFTQSKPNQNYIYQTLLIGKGTGEVYKAQDGAQIYLNTYLNSGGSLDDQKTDRVLIYGDVSGRTMVHVRGVSGSPGGSTGSGGNNQGISIIQVSGEANQNSFQLDGGYVTMGYSPYQYKLNAYGPKSDLGEASPSQRLVKGSGEFWDFRLESKSIDSDIKPGPAPAPGPSPEPSPIPPRPAPEPEVKAVVPQVPTYLLLPNALFHTGLMSIGSQNKQLEALRIASGGLLKNDGNPAFFVRGYGGNHRYTSNLSTFEYGYGGELDYNAVEAGVLLQTIENAYGTASFGIIGSYERFSLQPLDVEQSQKSAFDKWSVTAYGGMQCDTGFYVDGLLSYGLFKGDVHTLARGKTATLKGNPLSASLTSGKAFMIEDEGLIFDPQVQVVYQRLQFNKARDIDDFDIEMGNLDQWLVRAGGRLTKTLSVTDEARVVSFYGKLHLTHGFGGKQTVHFKDAFQLGAFGSSLETGLGFNARLSPKFALYGDLVYQHKLTKAGFSGTSFSGGLRYQF